MAESSSSSSRLKGVSVLALAQNASGEANSRDGDVTGRSVTAIDVGQSDDELGRLETDNDVSLSEEEHDDLLSYISPYAKLMEDGSTLVTQKDVLDFVHDAMRKNQSVDDIKAGLIKFCVHDFSMVEDIQDMCDHINLFLSKLLDKREDWASLLSIFKVMLKEENDELAATQAMVRIVCSLHDYMDEDMAISVVDQLKVEMIDLSDDEEDVTVYTDDGEDVTEHKGKGNICIMTFPLLQCLDV